MSRLIVLCSLCLTLVGCEVQTLYGIELLDFDDGEPRQVVRLSDHILYLSVGNHPDTPGFALIAISNDRPTDPVWDWEEFQSWSADKKALVFGSYFDQIYSDVNILHESTCPLMAEGFDHRGSAQEVAYGRWLHGMPKSDDPGDHAKGVSVRVPVVNCEKRLTRPAGDVEELTVIVDNGRDEQDNQVTVRFRVYVVDTGINWLF